MRIRVSDLWRWDGPIDRGPYIVLGVILSVIKYNLDRYLTYVLTGQSFIPLQYWVPGDVFGVLSTSPDRARIILPMLLLALPFLYSGVVLTLRRLRAAGLYLWLVVVFFIPCLNLLFFAALAVLPSREPSMPAERRPSFLDRLMPSDAFGAAALSLLLTLPPAAALTLFFANNLGAYGWGLFVGLPFVLGLVSSVLYGYRRPRSIGGCMAVACLSVFFLAVTLFVLAAEGLLCIMMAAPLAVPLAMFGAAAGYGIQSLPSRGGSMLALLGFLPVLMGVEAASAPEPPLYEVTSSVEIDAPPEAVWAHVVEFSELPPAEDWLFLGGIAYPIRAEISGRGPGAVRRCVFSTGAFVEPIEVWDEPHRLKFSVREHPPAMREMTLYPSVQPPHVNDYLVSRGGQFLLTPLPGGRTLLAGTTWYTHDIWPAPYWRLWSDWMIHKIHVRVLEHIQRRSQ